jgi:thymidylate kinase
VAVAQLVDALAPEPVLVFGSLPPAGRDLDLLARPSASEEIAAGLLKRGFLRREHRLARFAACSVEAVELVKAHDWGLSAAELEELYAAARPLDGFARLVRPSPCHALLLLARRLAAGGLSLEKLEARVASALDEDPLALERARERAAAWRVTSALDALAREYECGRRSGRLLRWRVVVERTRARPNGRRPSPLRAARRALTRHPRGTLITFSGLDGAGKSSQCEALCKTLQGLGHESVVEWSRLAVHPVLDRVALPVKRLLGESRAIPQATEALPEPPRRPLAPATPDAKRLSRTNPFVRFGWTTLVGILNVVTQRGATVRHLRQGRVVICDRYTLDSLVHLRSEYGDHRFRLQRLLVRRLSPKPSLAYFLEVRPQTALERKAEQFSLADLERHSRLYREEYAALGVHRLDGESSRAELCAEVAREVWEKLNG